MARFSMATNETFTNRTGRKGNPNHLAQCGGLGMLAEIAEKFLTKEKKWRLKEKLWTELYRQRRHQTNVYRNSGQRTAAGGRWKNPA